MRRGRRTLTQDIDTIGIEESQDVVDQSYTNVFVGQICLDRNSFRAELADFLYGLLSACFVRDIGNRNLGNIVCLSHSQFGLR